MENILFYEHFGLEGRMNGIFYQMKMEEMFDCSEIDNFHTNIKEENELNFNLEMTKNPRKLSLCNKKGVTALHIACMHPKQKINAFAREILSANVDVNARNYWKQTPLHYAASVCSVETMELLLRMPEIDVNVRDVIGYTVLHTFVSSCKKFNEKWKNGLRVLVDANIDINAQTNYGQTILHLVALQDDNSEMLGFIVSRYQNINTDAVNILGENFFHIYVTLETGINCMYFLKKLNKINNTTVKKLLNHQDASGSAPWCLMVERGELFVDHFITMLLAYDVNVNASDNLGNTALHRRVGKGGAVTDDSLEICHLMIQKGIDKDCRNIFGQSAASVVFYKEVYDLLQDAKVEFYQKDRWGRIPIFNLLQRDTNPSLLRSLLEKHPKMVNVSDCYEATPLHYAAYSGLENHIPVLLRFSPNLTSTDILGHTPLDTARYHGNRKSWQLLASEMNLQTSNANCFLFQCGNSKLQYSHLYAGKPVCELLAGFPKNLEEFSAKALKANYKATNMNYGISEVTEITEKVNQHVKRICKLVHEYDHRFQMTVFPTGSSAEGTKVGPPDEFDFVLCLESLASICEIETSELSDTGYAKLRFKENPVPDEFMSFSDNNRYFMALPFLHYLFRYIRRALNEKQLWENGQFYTRSEEFVRVIYNKPVFTFNMYWVGAHEKHLNISIDLVPGVYKRGWWPPHTTFANKRLVNDTVKAAGCLILMQTEENIFSKEPYQMKDSVTQTCNVSDANDKQRCLLISVAPAEIALMQSLPEIYREAYALAKIMKRSDICPDIEFDLEPPNIYPSIDRNFRNVFGKRLARSMISPSKEIKSYWMKNCIFYIADENTEHGLCEDTNPLHLATLAYRKLFDFAQMWNFRPYVLHTYDLFECTPGTYTFEVFIIRRKVCIEMMLALLGQRLDQHFMSWIEKCCTSYSQKNANAD